MLKLLKIFKTPAQQKDLFHVNRRMARYCGLTMENQTTIMIKNVQLLLKNVEKVPFNDILSFMCEKYAKNIDIKNFSFDDLGFLTGENGGCEFFVFVKFVRNIVTHQVFNHTVHYNITLLQIILFSLTITCLFGSKHIFPH